MGNRGSALPQGAQEAREEHRLMGGTDPPSIGTACGSSGRGGGVQGCICGGGAWRGCCARAVLWSSHISFGARLCPRGRAASQGPVRGGMGRGGGAGGGVPWGDGGP